MSEQGQPDTRLNRRIVKAQLKGNQEKADKLIERSMNKADRKRRRHENWRKFSQDWKSAMEQNRTEFQTGEEIKIKASKTVGFKPAPTLKNSL